VLARAAERGVSRILLPAIDSGTHAQMLDLEEQDPVCESMMGLHPCSVKEDFGEELSVVEGWLAKRKFVAIGETGLDFYWDKTYTAQQYEAFRRQISYASQLGIPVVIHSRDSLDECIAVVKERQDGNLKGVFHCFSGSVEQARMIRDLGFYLGIGGVVTFKNGGLDKVMEQVGLERVVLETDAPYLAPVPFRGKRNEPAYLSLVLEKLGQLLNMPAGDVARITTANANDLFGVEESG
jgi:TatD DNase family protein